MSSFIADAGPEAVRDYLASAFPGNRNAACFEGLAAFVCGAASRLPRNLLADSHDIHFVRLLQREAARRVGVTMADPVIQQIGPELDFLEHTCQPSSLSAIQFACLILQCRRVPKRRVAVLVMARDEGVYLPEWLAHHQLLGAEHVFVYTNDNTDGSELLLRQLAFNNYITLIEHKSAKGVNPQRKVYQHALLLLDELRDYRWVLVIDADEFLNFGSTRPGALPAFIHDMETALAHDLPAAVVFPWNWRYTNRAFHRDSVELLREYPHAGLHTLVKPLVNLQSALAMCEVHIPTLDEQATIRDGQMRPIVGKAVWAGVERPYQGPVIEHFWAKSFLEFLVKKRRGDELALEEGLFRRDYSQFFAWTQPWTAENRSPISEVWISQVKHRAADILAAPGVAAAYRAVIAGHRRNMTAMLQDPSLQRLYRDLVDSISPSM
ncbi:MAG: glycosyltransferase family 2 protein [Acetobacteraceae bacterium]